MLERPDANRNLIENLYQAVVPELVDINLQAQKEAGNMLASGHPDAREQLELHLVPDFMKNRGSLLMVESRDQRKLAEEVLNELHKKWHGTIALEHQVSDTLSRNYWEFVDNHYIPWTVTEQHNRKPGTYGLAVSASIKPGSQRPAEYQELLNKKEERLLKLEEEPRWLDGSQSTTTDQNYVTDNNRRKRAAKSISKWVSKTNRPPRLNRFE